MHFRGLSEFIEVSELDRKLVNVIAKICLLSVGIHAKIPPLVVKFLLWVVNSFN